MQNAHDPNDLIYLPPHVAALIGPHTVFQNVRFVHYQYRVHPNSMHGRRLEQEHRFLPLGRRARKEENYVEPSMGMSFEWSDRKIEAPELGLGKHRAASGDMIEDDSIVLAAQEMSTREEFKGFTVADLREIASVIVPGATPGRPLSPSLRRLSYS